MTTSRGETGPGVARAPWVRAFLLGGLPVVFCGEARSAHRSYQTQTQTFIEFTTA